MKRQLSVMTVMVAVFILPGCSTSKEELLPPGEQSMLEIWQGKGSGGHSRHMTAARDTLRNAGAAGRCARSHKLQPDTGK